MTTATTNRTIGAREPSQAQLSVDIRGTMYAVHRTGEPGSRQVVLEKRDGTIYAVAEGRTRATCTCPDFAKRHAPLDHTDGCKHIRSLVDLGMMSNGVACPPSAAAPKRDAVLVAQVQAQLYINRDWHMHDCQGAAPRLVDLECIRPDGAVDSEALADNLRIARDLNRAESEELCNSIVASIMGAHQAGLLAKRGAPRVEASASVDVAHESVDVARAPAIAPKTETRGRKPKYEGIDWAHVAARNDAGESRRELAAALGIPQSVVGEKIARVRHAKTAAIAG